MLVLALDTATPAVTAGVVEATADGNGHPLHAGHPRRPQARRAADAGGPRRLRGGRRALPDVDAVVVGVGPGPFTGLRVGMVTAAALGDALGVPVHGVCSLDAIAADVAARPRPGPLLVVTDARRREVYWAAYDGGVGSPVRTSRPPRPSPTGSPGWVPSRPPARAPE